MDGQQRIIVSDQGNFRIQVFDLEGKFLSAFGRKGTSDGEFLEPMGLALDSRGNLYVGDGTRDDVRVFDKNFTFVREVWDVKPRGSGWKRSNRWPSAPRPGRKSSWRMKSIPASTASAPRGAPGDFRETGLRAGEFAKK